jgi:nickel-dependent lactate racemase
MRIAVPFGQESVSLEVAPGRLIEVRRPPQPAVSIADPAAAVRLALEHPQNFPPLRRALTAEDRITVVVDEELPQLARLLTPLLEHITSAGVSAEAITLLCGPSSSYQAWLEEMPDEFGDVQVEVHRPGDRGRLCYLATTTRGRRLYLNHVLTEADQLIVLTGRGYDPLTSYSGAEAFLFPQFADEATRREAYRPMDLTRLGATTPEQEEAAEVAWLLGAPFFLQVLLGQAGAVTQVLGGLIGTSAEGVRLLDETWRARADATADVVVATVPGEAGPADFSVVARALGAAARAVRPKGRIIVLTQRRPQPGSAARLFVQGTDPAKALQLLWHELPPDPVAAFLWLNAAQRASVYLHSGLDPAAASSLFVSPLAGTEEVQGLVPSDASCLFLSDADRALVEVGVDSARTNDN